MSSEVAIKVEGLGKCYQIYDTPRDRLKQFIVPPLQRLVGLPTKQYCREFWALKDVSFEVRRGETIGIIGRNGSGKSTLLQLICGTLSPTVGSVVTSGRIAALLELGSGFNPEFSGRENVYMSCALLGLSNDEIDTRFDGIAAFADIGEFINQPVKTYSSGMFVRLAFAVNVVSSPDIMVVDEALAVGDIGFQAKCMTALSRFRENGGTVLFVSHDVGTVKSLCREAVHLERGMVVSVGRAATVAEAYMRILREEMSREESAIRLDASSEATVSEASNPVIEAVRFKSDTSFDTRVAQFRYGTGGVRITFAELTDLDHRPLVEVFFNQEIFVKIYLEAAIEKEISVNYYIQDEKKIYLLGSGFRTAGKSLLRTVTGGRYLVCYQTRLPLHEGAHSINLEITSPLVLDQTAEFLDVVDNAVVFTVRRRENGRLWAKVYVENDVTVHAC